MRRLIYALVFALASCVPAMAQATVILTDTGRASWGASPDHAATFGTPPLPVLTSYRAEVWLKVNVTAGVPSGLPAATFDWGKPTPDGTGTITGPLLKPLIAANSEYILFLSAVGPSGVSARTPASVPFGFPSAPRGVTSAATITP